MSGCIYDVYTIIFNCIIYHFDMVIIDRLLKTNNQPLSLDETHSITEELLFTPQLIAGASGEVNNARKDNFRSPLNETYAGLCAHSRDVTSLLFGDDVTEAAKDLAETNRLMGGASKEFGVLCCLTTPGLRKDIRRQIRQLYSHKITYYVHYNYILSSHLLSHFRIYFYY